MKNGIYFVTFSSNNHDVGQGTVVVKDNAINGGDFGFTYQGHIQ
ncbi:negative regulator GrlR, partial [Escherichia coli]|nr:negative regulator GrlR [Escherichia coli]